MVLTTATDVARTATPSHVSVTAQRTRDPALRNALAFAKEHRLSVVIENGIAAVDRHARILAELEHMNATVEDRRTRAWVMRWLSVGDEQRAALIQWASIACRAMPAPDPVDPIHAIVDRLVASADASCQLLSGGMLEFANLRGPIPGGQQALWGERAALRSPDAPDEGSNAGRIAYTIRVAQENTHAATDDALEWALHLAYATGKGRVTPERTAFAALVEARGPWSPTRETRRRFSGIVYVFGDVDFELLAQLP
jgi:hypothetical protein